MKLEENAANAVIVAVGNKVNAGGVGATLYGFLSSNEFVGLCGVVAALGGLGVAWWYRRKDSALAHQKFLLEKEESHQRMKYEQLRYDRLEEEITISQTTNSSVK